MTATRSFARVNQTIEPVTTVPLNGSAITPEKFEELKKQALQATEAAQKAALELEEAEKAKQESKKAGLRREYDGFMSDAENYRQASRNADLADGEKEKYLRWAAAAEANARELGLELGIVMPDPDEDEKAATIRRNRLHRILTICQVVGLLGILWMTLDAFFFVGELINSHNVNVPEGGQSIRPAYDLTSIQKYIFESFTMFADLPRAAIICLLVFPTIVLYVVPIIKSKKDFWTEFFHELTPWQRAIISVVTVLGFLLLSVLAHMAKP